jgi:hypothetical protein
VEFDRTNPINIPKALNTETITITTIPTRYPLLHKFNIICPTPEVASTLHNSILNQFSNQFSPLYLLYRSTDHTPRVVTKDQIPGVIDDSHPFDPHFCPKPLVSLNIPMVSTVVQDPFPSNLNAGLLGAATGAVIHGFNQSITANTLKKNLVHVCMNPSSLATVPSLLIQRLVQPRVFRNLYGSTLTQGTALWGGFFALRNYFLPKSTNTPSDSSGSDLSPAYALDGVIQSYGSNVQYTLPFALSLKVPNVFPTPSESTIASVKAAAIVAPLSFLIGSRQYFEHMYQAIYQAIGKLPYGMRFASDVLHSNVVATPPSVQDAAAKTTAAAVNAPKKQFPAYGLLNKRLYEAFFYDHGSQHLYTGYETNTLPSPAKKSFNPILNLKHWTNFFFPSQKFTEEYNSILSRSAGDISSKSASLLHTPPLSFTNLASRFKFQGAALLAAGFAWAHLCTTLYAYEFVKKRQFSSSGSPPYASFLPGSENPNADKTEIDKVFQNEIMHVPNLVVPKFTQFYQHFKNAGNNRTEIWSANRIIEQNDLLSGKSKLQGIRDCSVENMDFQNYADTIKPFCSQASLADPETKSEIKKRINSDSDHTTPRISSRLFEAYFTAISVSIASSLAFFPFINQQTRDLIHRITTVRHSAMSGVQGYAYRAAIIHTLVLAKIAYDDHHEYHKQQEFISKIHSSKTFAIPCGLGSPEKLADAYNPTFLGCIELGALENERKVDIERPFLVQAAESDFFSKNLVLPSKNAQFYKDLQENLYTNSIDPNNEYSILNKTTITTGPIFKNFGRFYKYVCYLPQMFGFNRVHKMGDDDDFKYLLKRGQYILPGNNFPQNCTDCLNHVLASPGSLQHCQCVEIISANAENRNNVEDRNNAENGHNDNVHNNYESNNNFDQGNNNNPNNDYRQDKDNNYHANGV